MAKFTVTLVEMKVGAEAKGSMAKFRGKTLTECVEFTPSLTGKGHDTSILSDANEKFGYVAAKLEAGKIHRAYRTSKVAKWAKEAGLTGQVKPAPSMEVEEGGIDLELEEAKATIARKREEAKAASKAKSDSRKAGLVDKARDEAEIVMDMIDAEQENARRDAEASVGEMLEDRRLKAIQTELSKKGYKIVAA